MNNITLNDKQVDKLITHIESMIDMCDDESERLFYEDYLNTVINQLKQ